MSYATTMDSLTLGDRLKSWATSIPDRWGLIKTTTLSIIYFPALTASLYAAVIHLEGEGILSEHLDRHPVAPVYFDINGDGRPDEHSIMINNPHLPDAFEGPTLVDSVRLAGEWNGQIGYFPPELHARIERQMRESNP